MNGEKILAYNSQALESFLEVLNDIKWRKMGRIDNTVLRDSFWSQ